MIAVRVVLDEQNRLTELLSNGHSGAAGKGLDIVCAAVSILVKTASVTLENRFGNRMVISKFEDGSLEWSLTYLADDPVDWVVGITDFLLTGLRDIGSQYPKALSFQVLKK